MSENQTLTRDEALRRNRQLYEVVEADGDLRDMRPVFWEEDDPSRVNATLSMTATAPVPSPALRGMADPKMRVCQAILCALNDMQMKIDEENGK
jgi:hypothetical protein